uniref:Uncharacterized protein n=1 Tax=Anguilla anguilla TaxID=7936 RepID=A0A0E9R504_ANGAN
MHPCLRENKLVRV